MRFSVSFSCCFVLTAMLMGVLLAGCTPSQTHEVRGRVVGFGDDGRTVIVEHEEVPGLMPPMTMPFTAADTGAVGDLSVGDAVAFSYTLTRDSSWIEQVRRLPDSAVAARPAGETTAVPEASLASRAPLLTPGDAVPPFDLVNRRGQPVRRADFEGQAFAVTFIYTSCPVPDFCPLMSERFAQLQPRLAERFGDRARLLSISFDPERDTPAVLSDYADRYTTASPPQWTFATGTPQEIARLMAAFGVFTKEGQGDEQQILHNLTTAVIGPDGRLQQIWRGNDWTTEEVLQAMERALNPSPS